MYEIEELSKIPTKIFTDRPTDSFFRTEMTRNEDICDCRLMKFKVFTKKLIIFLAFGFRAGESVLEHLTVYDLSLIHI